MRTVVGVNDPQAVKKWSLLLANAVNKSSYFTRKMMGEGKNSRLPIQMLTDLQSDAGDEITVDLLMPMSMEPIIGDETLDGKEQPLKYYTDRLRIDQVPGGWIIRYMHSTGASAFFIVVYLHMFRGLLYGSYRKPRELTWLFGVGIFLVLMGEAFFGYLLPWGQMSFWGAQVIINLFAAVPFIGPDLAILIRGDFVVGDATLNRFFSLHVIAVPLVLLGLVVAHVIALHEVGSNNPDGIEIKEKKDANGKPLDGIPFHPYYSVHDLLGVVGFLIVFSAVIFFAPEFGGYFLEDRKSVV